jgi:hypothetical protein
MWKTGEDSQETRTYRVATQRLFMADAYGPGDDTTLKGAGTRQTNVRQNFSDNSVIIWRKGAATWENGTIEPHLSQVFRVFAGQPDPRNASHFTIGYEVDGKPGTIDGWLLKDLTVVLEPREGRIVQQDVNGLRREWDPYADPPTTRPSDPSMLVPLLQKP